MKLCIRCGGVLPPKARKFCSKCYKLQRQERDRQYYQNNRVTCIDRVVLRKKKIGRASHKGCYQCKSLTPAKGFAPIFDDVAEGRNQAIRLCWECYFKY